MARHFDVTVYANFGSPQAAHTPKSRADVIDGEYSVVEPETRILDTDRKQD